jgi:hypothetical protein
VKIEPYVIVITYRARRTGWACYSEDERGEDAHGQAAHARRGAADCGEYYRAAGTVANGRSVNCGNGILAGGTKFADTWRSVEKDWLRV